MKVLVLGCGLQGKATVYDLCKSEQVKEITCADVNPKALDGFKKNLDMSKIKMQKLDVSDVPTLVELMKSVDVVIDLLPAKFINHIADAALEAGVHIVNTMYRHQMSQTLDERAKAKGITILPEAGLDPGIDLVLCGYGVSQFDEVYELHSWCGGIPEASAADNPLKYKITWTWYGVLLSYSRAAKIMQNGKVIEIPACDQFKACNMALFDFPGVGELEASPNGDAVAFCEQLGIMDTIKSTSRRALRWRGHCAFWESLVELGFLNDEPVPGLSGVTPRQFMDKHLEPRLRFKDDERDMVVMRITIKGIRDGKKQTLIYDMVDTRDLETGLFAMNRTVGFTASIAAQMIASNTIKRRGLLRAVRDIPYIEMIEELKKRGIIVTEKIIEE